VNLPELSVTAPPLDHRNGKYSCQLLVPSEIPYFAPPLACIALASAVRSSQVAGGALMPAFWAMSVR
jgi:hypothetical protein